MKQNEAKKVKKVKAKKEPTETVQPEKAVTPKEEYSAQNLARMDAYLSKKSKDTQSPAFESGEKENHIKPTGDQILHHVGITEALGTINSDLSHILTHQIFGVAPGGAELKVLHLNASLAVLHGIKPRDEIESLLAAQMVSVHNSAMEFMRRAILPDQTTEGVTANTERASKMLRTFTAQMEALNRHRGKGQQKVTVEHVTVNSGGQAIVGQVSHSKTE